MQGNWPIYQKQQNTEQQSHRCINNGSAGVEKEEQGASQGKRRGEWAPTETQLKGVM